MLQSMRWIPSTASEVHIWSDSSYVVESLRHLQVVASFPVDLDNSDVWRLIWDELQAMRRLLRIHKVPAHQDESKASDPLTEWAIRNNNLVDEAACAVNRARPAWFMSVWSRFVGAWQRQRRLLSRFAQLHLAIAEFDTDKPARHSDQMEVDDLVLDMANRHFEPISGFVSEGADSLRIDWIVQASLHSEFSFSSLSRLHSWALHLEGCADFECFVSHVELFVAFRLHRCEPISSICGACVENPFLPQTMAGDLQVFRGLLKTWSEWMGFEFVQDYVDLSLCGIHVAQPAVWFPWSFDVCSLVDELRQFVGRRPVTSAQGFSRPWRPARHC